MNPENSLQKNIGIFLGSIVLVGVLYVSFFLGKKSSDSTQVSDQTTSTDTSVPVTQPTDNTTASTPAEVPAQKKVVQTPPVDIPKKSASTYTDGTYSATGSYMSPGGYDQLGVSITLKNDIITDASVTNMAGDGRSQRYQDNFISGYKQYVIGKNISTLYLSKISRASLTTKGFNDALAQIKSQAKA